MTSKDKERALADILFPTENQVQLAESILQIPPEQRRLHTESYDFTVSTLVDYLRGRKIAIPRYQRRYIWTDSQASRLIESLIIQCPIPVVYLNQEKDETLSVIDGNQRLTSLRRYLNNEFKLSGLTAYPELEGYAFFELDPRFQRHIENRTIRCLVILKDTHPQVKFDVFERLNTGSVRLTPQELRHGIYYGDLITLSEALARNSDFSAMVEFRDNKRMKLEELVIRFLSFRFSINEYKKPLSGFLNSFCEANKLIPNDQKQNMEREFLETVHMAKRMYGEYAFKVLAPDRKILSRFNAALFDAEMAAANSIFRKSLPVPDQDLIISTLIRLWVENADFKKAVIQATSDEQQVKARISILEDAFGIA